MPTGITAIVGIVLLVAMVLVGIGLTWVGLREDSYAHSLAEEDQES